MMSGVEVYKVTLKQTMEKFQVKEQEWSDDVIDDLIKSWESASGKLFYPTSWLRCTSNYGVFEAWNDTAPGLRLLRKKFIL